MIRVRSIVHLALLVEPLAILHMFIWIVGIERIRCNFVVRVAEVNVPHIFLVEKHIGVESVIVPMIVQVLLSMPALKTHHQHVLAESVGHIGPHNRSDQVEPGVDWAQELVIGVL